MGSLDSQELEREEARINVTKPYKPRKLKQDQYHRMVRDAQKYKPDDSAKDAKNKRVRDKWVQKNKPDLERRAEFVRKQKKLLTSRSRFDSW
jgi:hypothetical protein